MKKILLFLIVCCASVKVEGHIDEPVDLWTEPKVWKYPGNSVDYLPINVSMAKTKGWQKVDFLKPRATVDVYCPYPDKTLCGMFDSNQRIVGLVITILKNSGGTRRKVSPLELYNNQWFDEKKNITDYYVMKIYFVDEKHLKKPAMLNPMASIGNTFRIINKNGKNSTLKVPVKEDQLKSKWDKQNCIPTKGTHYTYKKNNGTDCKNYLPITMLVKDKEVVVFNFILPGNFKTRNTQYFESINYNVLKDRFPNMPKCLETWKDYGFSSIYVSLVPLGYLQECKNEDHVKPPTTWTKMSKFFRG